MVSDGRLPVPGGSVYYRIFGRGPGLPLLLLHGGPGGGMRSLDPLLALADERPLILYDQLGCGRSDRPRDAALWRLDRFVDEVEAVRRHLNLDEIGLFGHSWGGMLALEYLLRQPRGVRGAILSNSIASISLYLEQAWRLVDAMPGWPRRVLRRHVRPFGLGRPSYQVALLWFLLRHAVRLHLWPDLRPIVNSLVTMYFSPSFRPMWGPDDLHVTGSLSTWERADRLGEIDVPALVVTGEYDEVTPRAAAQLADGLRRGRLEVLAGCSHMSFFERPQAYLGLVRPFLHALDGVDGKERAPIPAG